MKSIISICRNIETVLQIIVVVIVLFSVGQSITLYLREYQSGILANIRASIYLLEGLSMAFSFLIAISVIKLTYLQKPQEIYLILLLTIVKKINTVFLNQDIETTRKKKKEFIHFG